MNVLAGEVLHDHVRVAGRWLDAGVEHLDHVRRVDRAARPRLALEAREHAVLLRERRGDDDLQRDAPLRPAVHGLVDGSHAALAEDSYDVVLAVDRLARDERGRLCRHTPVSLEGALAAARGESRAPSATREERRKKDGSDGEGRVRSDQVSGR